LLESDKDYFTDKDVILMKDLADTIANISDMGKIEVVKGLFSKGEENIFVQEDTKMIWRLNLL